MHNYVNDYTVVSLENWKSFKLPQMNLQTGSFMIFMFVLRLSITISVFSPVVPPRHIIIAFLKVSILSCCKYLHQHGQLKSNKPLKI